MCRSEQAGTLGAGSPPLVRAREQRRQRLFALAHQRVVGLEIVEGVRGETLTALPPITIFADGAASRHARTTQSRISVRIEHR